MLYSAKVSMLSNTKSAASNWMLLLSIIETKGIVSRHSGPQREAYVRGDERGGISTSGNSRRCSEC